jgi:GNAT superfamily N-acetyltransferase
MKVEIVSFQDKYSNYFYELNYDWLNEYFYVEEYDEIVLKNCKQEIINKGGYIFFAIYNSDVVATMALIPREKGVYELNKMAVKKELRGNGIGHQLIKFTIDFAKRKNYNSIILYSNKVLKNSIHLYNKFGFKEIKSEGNTPYKRSDIKMELILSDF